jgi:hypothetical protein
VTALQPPKEKRLKEEGISLVERWRPQIGALAKSRLLREPIHFPKQRAPIKG